jgi:uncharacterized protein
MGAVGARRSSEPERGFAPPTSNRVGFEAAAAGGAARVGGVVGRVTTSKPPLRFRRLPHAEVCLDEAPQQRRGSAPLRSASLRVPVAVTFPSRLLGLALLRPGRAGAGLLLPRCRSVHTFGMRFALRVVFLDGALAPVSVREAVPPRRIVREPRAGAVLELPVAAG